MFWTRSGVRVREVLAELCDVPESRLDLRAPIDDTARFDLTVLPPRHESPEAMRQSRLEEVLKHFDLEIRRDPQMQSPIVVRGRGATS